MNIAKRLKVWWYIGHLVVFQSFLFSTAQEYIPMNFEQGRWSVELDGYEGWDEKIQVYCSGDTLIDNLLYSKLFQNRLRRIPPGEFFIDTIFKEFLGAIRNTEDKKVILLNWHLDTIYDFNLSVGDTIMGAVDNMIINYVDSVEYCGRYHKRYVDTLINQSATEGIGYSTGLLGYFYPFNQNEVYYNLVCYTERNILDCQACEFFVSHKSYIHKTSVYPNPAENIIIIRSSKPIIYIRLLDIQGQEVLFKEVNNQYIVEEEIEKIGLGVYLIVIKFSDHSTTTSQLIKS